MPPTASTPQNTVLHPRAKTTGKYIDREFGVAEFELRATADENTLSQARVGSVAKQYSYTADRSIDQLGAAKMLAEARRQVEAMAKFAPMPEHMIDEAVSITVEKLVHLLAKGPVGHKIITTNAGQSVSSLRHVGFRHEDVKARKVLDAAIAREEAELGRTISQQRFDELVVSIRDDWHDPRHRPGENYHHAWDGIEFDTAPEELFELGESDLTAEELEPAMESALDEAEQLGLHSYKSAYEIWSKGRDLPTVVPALPKKDADKLTAMMSGRIVEAALLHLNGGQADALFAPFSGISHTERNDLAESLASNPAYAERLWASALSAAVVVRGRATRVSLR